MRSKVPRGRRPLPQWLYEPLHEWLSKQIAMLVRRTHPDIAAAAIADLPGSVAAFVAATAVLELNADEREQLVAYLGQEIQLRQATSRDVDLTTLPGARSRIRSLIAGISLLRAELHEVRSRLFVAAARVQRDEELAGWRLCTRGSPHRFHLTEPATATIANPPRGATLLRAICPSHMTAAERQAAAADPCRPDVAREGDGLKPRPRMIIEA